MRALTAGRYRYHTWPEFREHKGSLVRPSPPLPPRAAADRGAVHAQLRARARGVRRPADDRDPDVLPAAQHARVRAVRARVWGGEGRG